jgi:phosphoribosylglycinamide formyltransferase 1
MKKIAIFASGSGTNFQAILDATSKNRLNAEIALLVCDRPGAKVIERAERAGVRTFVFSPKDYESKQDFEKKIIQQLQAMKIELVVLAGYMRLIGDTLLAAYKNKIINIHPSLLPSFPGKDAIGQAFRAGVRITGITVHYVDEGMDTGPIISQTEIEIEESETIDSLEKKIHHVEHRFYPDVLNSLVEN